jgi:hypothetical protein
MTKDSGAMLRPVAFGSRRCRGNEVHLHSHLGEGFAGDWAINKNRHYLFGKQFVWVTDCYAIRFILSYDGNNPAILRLQMRLMCWDVTIVHWNDSYLPNQRGLLVTSWGRHLLQSKFQGVSIIYSIPSSDQSGSNRFANVAAKHALLPWSVNCTTG